MNATPANPLLASLSTNKLRPVALGAAFFVGSLFASQAMAFTSGSTGADGAFAPTVNTEIQLPPSGVLNYTSVNIPAGVTVTFKKNVLNTPVYMLVSGDATIAGSIDISGTRGASTGTAGNGNLADDGNPGIGGPGGYGGGQGGRPNSDVYNTVVKGGAGLGPGGGGGGIDGRASVGCPTGDTSNWSTKNLGGLASYAAIPYEPNYNVCSTTSAMRSLNGLQYGSAILQPLIGGSGGGGGAGGGAFAGEGGGGGGGAVLLAVTGTANITGRIQANGSFTGSVNGTNAGGKGGAGAGGAIRIVATAMAGNGKLFAVGGCYYSDDQGANAVDYCTRAWGEGQVAQYLRAGQGRIRMEVESTTFSGTVVPAASVDTPGPVFLANVPTLRISKVGGQDVPANPTGKADLSFPATLTNPVTVEFTTTSVPAGNTVKLQVIPSQGSVIEALTPAIVVTGSTGTASVQVSLPQGPSVLQASTTYTVVVAMGDALSHFAQNERVEKVELIATLGKEPQAKLITVSGKEYMVPAAVLQTVGLAG